MSIEQPPSEPPTSGPAVEMPPHGERVRPETIVYDYGSRALWIFWPDRWQYAAVRARQTYPTGAVVYQVELQEAADSFSRVSRAFLWGPDSIRVPAAEVRTIKDEDEV